MISVNFVTFLILWHSDELTEALKYANRNRKLIKTVIKGEMIAKAVMRTDCDDDETSSRPFSPINYLKHEAGVSRFPLTRFTVTSKHTTEDGKRPITGR
jgi:hypothetical protein